MMNPAPKSKGDSSRCFSLFAPAKVNLGLKILGKRPDGYHELRSLFLPLSIGDRINFEVLKGGWSGSCDRPEVPMGEGSLAERAFRYAARRLGFEGGLSVRIEKEIPLGAGLGGGSSDAAAVMRGVEQVTGRSIPATDYPEIAHEIGADVPFFLKGGPKWVEGIGERVTPVAEIPPLHLLLVNPGVSISTKWVYSELGKSERVLAGTDLFRPAKRSERSEKCGSDGGFGGRAVSHPEFQLTSPGTTASFPRAFGSLKVLLPYLTNDLESVVLPRFPAVGEIKNRLIALGVDAALMSGSGSTVFGLFSDPKKRDLALKAFRREYPQWWICAAHSGVV